MNTAPRTWTQEAYFDRAQRKGLLHPDDRAMAEAVARAEYFVRFLLEDLPHVIVQGSSADTALGCAIVIMQMHREGRLPMPYDPREKGGT
jgi:hypothetical protein